ncbi:MAG: c-type cytochrome biogenesis protein CcmI [Proteobacteria bacterium]|nr:c-type cytochrome biogenesis protein CcmI [Pseudomonadota bacterium]
MTGIYFWGLIVFAAAAAALAWPLLRTREEGEASAATGQDEGLLLLRDRLLVQLDNVERDKADATMDETVASAEIARIEAELAQALAQLDQMEVGSGAQVAPGNVAKWVTPALVAVLLVGAGLYGALFMEPITNEQIQASSSKQDPHAGMQGGGMPPQVMEMIKGLEDKLKADPDNLDGWKRLARSYQVMRQMGPARDALAQAYRLAPNDVDVLAQYASVSYATEPGNTEGKAAELFNRLYELQPTNASALWFKGIASFQKADYKQAISYWETTLKHLPADSPARKEVQNGINEAHKRQNAS